MIFFNNCIQSEEFALIRVLWVVQWILALLDETLHLLLMTGGENLSLLEGVEKASVQNSRVCVSKFLHENESLSSNMKVPLSTMEPSFLYSLITFCTASGCHHLSWYVSPKGQLFGETVSVHEHSRCRWCWRAFGSEPAWNWGFTNTFNTWAFVWKNRAHNGKVKKETKEKDVNFLFMFNRIDVLLTKIVDFF